MLLIINGLGFKPASLPKRKSLAIKLNNIGCNIMCLRGIHFVRGAVKVLFL